MPQAHPDDAALRETCAAVFADPSRLFHTLTHRVQHPFRIEPHVHADLLQLDLLVGCGGRAWSEGRWLGLEKITALVSYPNEPHGYELTAGEPPSRVYHLKLRLAASSQLIKRRTLPRCVTGMNAAEGLIAAMRLVVSPASAAAPTPLHTARLAEVICLWPRTQRGQSAEQSPSRGQVEPWITAAIETIRQRVSDPPSLAELAATAGVSTRHFARVFTHRMGTPPHAYITARRLAVASDLLLARQLKVRQIATAVGFSSVATFSRWFTTEAGLNPRRYREDPTLL
jgi:AraC-like DNA-binding protein